MSFPTLFPDCLILAAVAYPSGFSQSLFTVIGRPPRIMSLAFLGVLVLPYLAVALVLGLSRPEFLRVTPTTFGWLMIAALAAPLMLGLEAGMHGLQAWRASGRFPRTLQLPPIWRVRLGWREHCLIALIVVGEEFLYRQVWTQVLHDHLGLTYPVVLGVSSIAYGLNHLGFGAMTVFSKSVCGLVYGTLAVLGGSLWLPILAHSLQNLLLFRLTAAARHE